MKLSLIFAVLSGHKRLEYEDVSKAINIVNISLSVVTSLAPELGLGKIGKLESRILAHLKRGPTTARDLYRALNISAQECKKAVEVLIDAQDVDERYGRLSLR